ncbi:MAG: DUF433 domain-containing protein [Chloroflexota bacterium]
MGERIEVNPKILSGKPVIKGTRIPVYLVLELLSRLLFQTYSQSLSEFDRGRC